MLKATEQVEDELHSIIIEMLIQSQREQVDNWNSHKEVTWQSIFNHRTHYAQISGLWPKI